MHVTTHFNLGISSLCFIVFIFHFVDEIMKITGTEFKRYRIILAMTSLMEKYSLTKLRTNESFNLTENNKLDISGDIKKLSLFYMMKDLFTVS